MVPKLKEFIEDHIDLIEEKRWSAVYSYAKAEIPFQVGNLSYNLIKAGVNPLDDINRVPSEMFCDAQELREIELPENILAIMRQAFKNCYQLTKLVLPLAIESIDETAFEGCYELKEVIYKGTAQELLNKVNITEKMFWDTEIGTITCSDADIMVRFDDYVQIKERT